MIVVDTNVIAYLLLPGAATPAAERLVREDAEWCAPLLWRSEFCNVLAGYLRRRNVELAAAIRIAEAASGLVRGREFSVRAADVLEAVSMSTCSAYDCEFVVLARELRLPLVTTDRRILRDFPDIATALPEFAAGSS